MLVPENRSPNWFPIRARRVRDSERHQVVARVGIDVRGVLRGRRAAITEFPAPRGRPVRGPGQGELRLRQGAVRVGRHPQGQHHAPLLAVRVAAPIFAAEQVLEEAAVILDESDDDNQDQMVEQFREFIEKVNPEDFV